MEDKRTGEQQQNKDRRIGDRRTIGAQDDSMARGKRYIRRGEHNNMITRGHEDRRTEGQTNRRT